MRATVDPNLCIGCSLCTEICPTVFAMGGDMALVVKDPVPVEAELACRDAKEQCPVNAIDLA